jgi:hypothetical protein
VALMREHLEMTTVFNALREHDMSRAPGSRDSSN